MTHPIPAPPRTMPDVDLDLAIADDQTATIPGSTVIGYAVVVEYRTPDLPEGDARYRVITPGDVTPAHARGILHAGAAAVKVWRA